jgi:hypothetical protein
VFWFVQVPAHGRGEFPQFCDDRVYLFSRTESELAFRNATEGETDCDLRPNSLQAELRCFFPQVLELVYCVMLLYRHA